MDLFVLCLVQGTHTLEKEANGGRHYKACDVGLLAISNVRIFFFMLAMVYRYIARATHARIFSKVLGF